MDLILSGLTIAKQKGNNMKITEFNEDICKLEGGKEELNIAQVSEVIKIANKLTNGVLYRFIELMSKCKKCSI